MGLGASTVEDKAAFILRPLEAADLPALTALDGECFPPEDAYSPEVMAWFFSLPGAKGLGYFDDGALAAFVLWSGAEIITLDTAPAHRRRGLGRSLMERASSAIREKGYPAALLQVDRDNIPALTLYRSLGFKITEEYRENGKRRHEMVLRFPDLSPGHQLGT
jgi:ribosomal protein S18 acetylase RimI-like enzyme